MEVFGLRVNSGPAGMRDRRFRWLAVRKGAKKRSDAKRTESMTMNFIFAFLRPVAPSRTSPRA
jgi:hypothetical protein